MRSAIVLTLLPLWMTFFSTPTRAAMSEDEKKMGAASIVLAAASQNGGTVVVQSGDGAFMNPSSTSDYHTTFRKMSDCVYGEYMKAPKGYKDQYHVIDFSKLTGRWQESGSTIDFVSKGDAHCSSYIGGCWHGALHIMSNMNHQQMVDDVGYLLRHGCNASVNNDPDPH